MLQSKMYSKISSKFFLCFVCSNVDFGQQYCPRGEANSRKILWHIHVVWLSAVLSVPRFPYANVLSQSEKWRATESGYYVYRRMNLQILINLNGEVIVSCSDTIVAISNIDIVVQDLLQTPATTVQILTNNRLLRIGSFYL